MRRITEWRAFKLLLIVAIFASLGACSSTRTVADELDDAEITSRVKARIAADPEVNPFEIDVDTTNRVVTLRGAVENNAARSEAEQLARGTAGVRQVVNRLQVGDPTTRQNLTDAMLVAKVKAKLIADPDVSSFDIDVDALGGIITLHGKVKTAEQRREAESLASNTSGVRGVRNEITIQGASG